MNCIRVATLTLALSALLSASAAEHPVLMPKPREVTWGAGQCALASKVAITQDASLPAEGYRLEISAAKGVQIRHADAAGLFYAQKTLAQLGASGKFPEVTIRDWPEYPFRAVLIDDARVCYGRAALKKIIDQMAEVKLNVLHWHFIEPGAWRMEVPGYPKLTAGAVKHGERYGRVEIKEMVDYAAARHVRVLPEVEMPGHNDAEGSYPELRHEGGHGLCPVNPKTIAFFKAALDEAASQFPEKIVHFGGDEVGYGSWKKCKNCQAKMKELGIKDEADLQAWFMGIMSDHLLKRGKTPMGWSDMLLTLTDNMHTNAAGWWTGYSTRKNLSKDIVINAWYGDWECPGGCGAVAANLGYKVIQYPSNHCYFDHAQGLEGDTYKYGYNTALGLVEAYDWNPRSDVRKECRANVIGVGCANWSEKGTDLKALEWKLWPRGFATAEIGWCGGDKRDVADFVRRAKAFAEVFRARGIHAAKYTK